MSQYTNAQILSAVVNQWAQPIISQMTTLVAADKLMSIPMINNLENLAKNWGIVGPNYSILNELPQLISPISSGMLIPYLNKQISNIDDTFIPKMAHDTVDSFISQGGLVLFGRLKIEGEDFSNLKQLLNINLPLVESDYNYVVKTQQNA